MIKIVTFVLPGYYSAKLAMGYLCTILVIETGGSNDCS